MKLSLDWLSDFVALTEKNPHEIARRVTAGVSEVDEVEIQGGLLEHCCVGRVASLRRHPGADRLSLCDVQTDRGVKKVVCGGSNLRDGMRVAFAHVGATVRWHGTEMMTLATTKIRGEESEGMICTAEELDLQSRFPESKERVLIDLGDGDEGVGKSLKEFLGIGDVVLHIDNHAITHRADLFSHVGYAREFVALGLGEWKRNEEQGGQKRKEGQKRQKGQSTSHLSALSAVFALPVFPKTALPFRNIIDDKHLVTRYLACMIEIDGPGVTPDWMKKRLEAVGWRSINLPIDITNYVATEMGMPLHSFDADDIKGDIHIRAAKKGETIITLDNVKRELPDGAIVMSDDDGIFDLFGIMGGLRSSTKESTRRIYLHAAIPDPVAIRKTVIATGHRTDAATVYEKGVPRITAERGLLRAIDLFLAHVPGARITSKLESWGDDGTPEPIELSLDYVSKMLGTELSEKKIVKILEDLEFSVQASSGKRGAGSQKKKATRSPLAAPRFVVTPPLHRLGDIRGPHDLVEEIGRVAGYDGIEPTMPTVTIKQVPAKNVRLHRLRDSLAREGFYELVPLSLLSSKLLERANLDPSQAVEICNPIGEELKLMQTSVLPSLLEHATRNVAHAGPILRTFTAAHVFQKGKPEYLELGVLVTRTEEAVGIAGEPFYLLKDHLRAMFAALGFDVDVSVTGTAPSSAHPGRHAELMLRPKATADGSAPSIAAGVLYEIHPAVRERFGLRHRAAAALVDLTALLAIAVPARVPAPVPQFPAVSYDETVSMTHKEQIGPLLRTLDGHHPLLEHVALVDVYAGPPLAADAYNATLRFTYRAADRTLTEEEAKKVHGEMMVKVGIGGSTKR